MNKNQLMSERIGTDFIAQARRKAERDGTSVVKAMRSLARLDPAGFAAWKERNAQVAARRPRR